MPTQPSFAQIVNTPVQSALFESPSAENLRLWLSSVDFSGVSLAGSGSRPATLISSRHAIQATHYRTAVGQKLRWMRRDGVVEERVVVESISLANNDLTVIRLNADLDGVAIYQALPPGEHWGESIPGCLSLHIDQRRNFHLKEIVHVSSNSSTVANIRYNDSGHIPMPLRKKLISGDSGHPFFLKFGNRLVLLGCHWTSSSGPFLSDPRIFNWLNAAIAER